MAEVTGLAIQHGQLKLSDQMSLPSMSLDAAVNLLGLGIGKVEASRTSEQVRPEIDYPELEQLISEPAVIVGPRSISGQGRQATYAQSLRSEQTMHDFFTSRNMFN